MSVSAPTTAKPSSSSSAITSESSASSPFAFALAMRPMSRMPRRSGLMVEREGRRIDPASTTSRQFARLSDFSRVPTAPNPSQR